MHALPWRHFPSHHLFDAIEIFPLHELLQQNHYIKNLNALFKFPYTYVIINQVKKRFSL